MKRNDLSNRIWRTVVFSGAMLAAPLAAADQQPVPQKQPAKAADTHESVTKELEANTAQLLAAVDDVVKQFSTKERAGQGTAMALASSRLEEVRKARTAIEARLAKLPKPPAPAAAVAKAQKALADHDAKLLLAADAFGAATTDKDLAAAVDKLKTLRAQRAPLDKKLKAEITNASRPRANKEDRPLGRGFILS
jgi:hypothetical protein